MKKQKIRFGTGEEPATLRSMLIGVGGVLGVVVAVAVFNPRMLRRPAPPPVPTLVQGQITAAPGTPAGQAIPVGEQDAAAAPESPAVAASSQAFASASPTEANPVGEAAQAPPSGETAELPQPAPQARPIIHRARQPLKKPLVTHHAPSQPAGAGPEVPAAAVPPVVAEQPAGVVVGSRYPKDVPSRRVTLADLNLGTDAGACKALGRITRAAGEVCPFEGERELSFVRQRRMCMEESVNRAVQDTHASRVEALHAQGSGGC